MHGTIFDIKHFAIHDGPGIRQTIFFNGCSLSCWWCHNPEGRSCDIFSFENEEILEGEKLYETKSIGKEYAITDLISEIKKDTIFFEESGGGVTFSGGEPLLQYDFVAALLKKCKDLEIHTCIDTTGNISSEKLINAASYTDLFLYDIKHIDEKQHIKYTGISNKLILNNLKLLDEMEKDIWIRFPLIPEINDNESDLLSMMEFLSQLKKKYPISILPYHKIGSHKYKRFGIEYKMNGIEEYCDDDVKKIKNMFNEGGFMTI
ncbi:MAG TPA: glycyl-radical enzyme activating protein [Bacteroidales bacterium]|jgi:pyruvate formate lyase activating enzyme|nr:glycyl-radical enzyme activating protein [Bacteroidales bacterium]|tara:strand:+ start:463 stop:1248 length:786 start_codon:yes stop_codon:yes gene_type:complete